MSIVDSEAEWYTYVNESRIQSVSDWEMILKNEIENHRGFDFVSKVLIEMYKIPDYTMFCHEFEKRHNIGGLNLRVGEFRNRIRKLDNITFPIQLRSDSNTDRAWNIPFKTSEDINSLKENSGKFCWILREELIEAMENIMPYIKEYRAKYSKQYLPIECYDNSILDKPVRYLDAELLLNNAHESDIIYKKESADKKLPKKTDYLEKQIRNKMVGDSGENKVKKLEQERLKKAGRIDLANKVHIVDSDAYGYDIESYDVCGNVKHIEVKTSTSEMDRISFYLTVHEVEVMQQDDSYELHYLYNIKGKEIKTVVFDSKQLKIITAQFMKPTQYAVSINGMQE